jgi:hypothetical protein
MDHPDHSRLAWQQAVLSRAGEARQQLLGRYMIGIELESNSSLSSGERKTRLRERLGRLDSQIPASIPEPDSTAVEGLDPVVARGLALAAGETVPPSPTRDTFGRAIVITYA